MKEFLKILRRFVPPYKKYLFLNIFFNILAAFLTLFSFALIIPILEMLFMGDKGVVYHYMGGQAARSRMWQSIISTILHIIAKFISVRRSP